MPGVTLTTDVDNTRLNSGLEAFHEKVATVTEESVKDMGEFGKSMTKLGPIVAGVLAVIGGFKEAVGEAFSKAQEVQKMAGELQITREAVQNLSSAAKFYGIASDELSANLNKLAENTQKALNGSQEQAQAYEDLNISADDLKGKSLDQVFDTLSDAVANSTDKHKAMHDVQVLMGKTSHELTLMLEEGSEAIHKQGEQTVDMGANTINTLNAISRGWGILSEDIVSVSGTAFAYVENSWNVCANVIAGGINLLGIEFRTLGNAAYDSLHGNFNKIEQDFLDGSAQMQDAIDRAKKGVSDAWNVPKLGADVDASVFSPNGDGGFTDNQKEIEAESKLFEIKQRTAEKERAAAYEALNTTQKIADLEQRIAQQKSIAAGNFVSPEASELVIAEAKDKLADLELEKAKLIKDQKKEHVELEKQYAETMIAGDTSHKDRIVLLNKEQDILVDAVIAATDKNDRLKAEIALEENKNAIKKEYTEMAKEELDLARQKAAQETKNQEALRGTIRNRRRGRGNDDPMGGDLLANYTHYNRSIVAGYRDSGMGSIEDSVGSKHSSLLDAAKAKKAGSSQSAPDTTTPLLTSIDRTQKQTLNQIKLITTNNLGSGDQSFISA